MTLSENTCEFKLAEPPSDCIQSVKFGPSNSQFLLAASWDCHVRLYDIYKNKLKTQYKHSSPVFDCAFQVSHIPPCSLLFIDLFSGPKPCLEWWTRQSSKSL